MSDIRPISTAGAPTPAGHYAQAVVHDGTVYVSGLLPHDPKDPAAPLGGVETQVRRVMSSLGSILDAAGSGMEHLLQVTIYLPDLDDWSVVNRVFAEFLGDHRPARAVVPVRPLKRDAALELVAIAAVRQRR